LKTILVTGASSGIGRALAVQAARAGYAVYAVGRNVRALAALAGQVEVEGGTIVTDVTDVSDPANAPGLIGRAVGAFGHVDILVNNAGAVAVGPIATQSDEAMRLQFGTHVIGPLALTREALPTLRACRGHVFMLGSGVARVPVGGLGAYPPSKAALRSATSILRREVAALDIAVTYVDPGAVDTGFMTRAGMPGAPRNVLVSPELVARKILLAVMTRPRVLNVAPLQTVAVTIAEMFPAITDVVLEMNPALIGAGPSLTAIEMQRDANGRGEKIALPSARVLAPPDEDVPAAVVPAAAETVAGETVDIPAPIEDDIVEDDDDADVLVQPVPEPAAEAPLPRLEPAPVPPPAPAPVDATEEPERQFTARWQFEPPDADVEDAAPADVPAPAAVAAATAPAANGAVADDDEHELFAGVEPTADHDIEPPVTTRSFDAALESLHRRMERAKLSTDFVRSLLVVDTVIDVGDAAMRWAGMPNKHERALTSEVFFALAEWGFLAPRADGRYRVLYSAEDDPAV
jgi:short-subunit dehydrogenase